MPIKRAIDNLKGQIKFYESEIKTLKKEGNKAEASKLKKVLKIREDELGKLKKSLPKKPKKKKAGGK